MYCVKKIKLYKGISVQEIADILTVEKVLATDATIETMIEDGTVFSCLVIPDRERQKKVGNLE